MRRPQEIAKEEKSMATLSMLTNVLEGIASMRISQIKNQVLQAQEFFGELWNIYSQLRVDDRFRFGRDMSHAEVLQKDLLIGITAEGGFSGDIDQRLIESLASVYEPDKHDIVVIGQHGAVQLHQAGIAFTKYFRLPIKDQNLQVEPLIGEIKKYRSTTVYYQTYVSLMVQEIKHIELGNEIQARGQSIKTDTKEEIIGEENYIFEPSTLDVVSYLEHVMLQIAISQVILESKLAQYASRFRAMSSAHTKAEELRGDFHSQYSHAKRAMKDERLKEIINGLRKIRATV